MFVSLFKLIPFSQVPDSPRWHFSNGRDEVGIKLSEKFAKHNHKILTEKDWVNAEVTQVCKQMVVDTAFASWKSTL